MFQLECMVSTMTGIISRNNRKKIIKAERKQNGDCQALTMATLAIQKVITVSLQLGINNIIVESDSQIAMKSIIAKAQAPRQIRNLISDIKKLASNVYITFTY